MTKLSIAILTYNRSQHIKEDLEWIVNDAKSHSIDIYVLDGSSNDDTTKVVDTYDVNYLKCEDAIQRVKYAFSNIDSEYIWLCGDKNIVNPALYDEIVKLLSKNIDVLTIYGGLVNSCQRITYFNNPSDFLNFSCAPLTHFGSTIIKRSNINLSDIDYIMSPDRNVSSFCVQYMMIKSFPLEQFCGVFLFDKQAKMKSQYNTASSTAAGSHIMWNVWINEWVRFIDFLPQNYDKNYLYSIMDTNAQFFSRKNLIRQRLYGEYNLKTIRKYRNEIKKVINIPIGELYLYLLIPKSRYIASFVETLKKNLRRIMKKSK